jgi:hypothetical protein
MSKKSEARFAVQCTCCGRDGGTHLARTWQDADEYREAYLSGPGVDGEAGHKRSAIIVAVDVVGEVT